MRSDDEKRQIKKDMTPLVLRTLADVHDGLRQYIRRTLRNKDEADDVMQQFCLRVILHASEPRREESIRAWLRQVLSSALSDHLRKRASRRRADAAFARKEAATPPPEDDMDQAICMCLHKLLPTLKPEYAEVLRRAELERELREAIAASLGLTAGNLMVRLHRARQVLRQALDLTCETCPIHGYFDCGCEYTKRLRTTLGRARSSSQLREV